MSRFPEDFAGEKFIQVHLHYHVRAEQSMYTVYTLFVTHGGLGIFGLLGGGLIEIGGLFEGGGIRKTTARRFKFRILF